MNNIDLMNFWIESANEDYNVMLDLKEKNRNLQKQTELTEIQMEQ